MHRRGYPVAILIGFDSNMITLWNIFSKAIKPLSTLQIESGERNSKTTYNLNEQIINALRPTFSEGVRSLILVSPPRTTFAKDLRDHVGKHHSWLLNGSAKIAFAELPGSANSLARVTELVRNTTFQKVIRETMTEETTNLLELLETRLSISSPKETVFYSIKEAENIILRTRDRTEADYLLLTDKYLADHRERGRLNRLLQIASNKKVKTRIINTESPAGKRLSQLGGFVCLKKTLEN